MSSMDMYVECGEKLYKAVLVNSQEASCDKCCFAYKGNQRHFQVGSICRMPKSMAKFLESTGINRCASTDMDPPHTKSFIWKRADIIVRLE